MSEAAEASAELKYRRVLLKISGESLADSSQRGIDMNEVGDIAKQILQATQSGCQIAVVSGGGNILRGAQFSGRSVLIQEATAHYMGMLATVINSLSLQDALESIGCTARVMSSIPMDGVCETFERRRAVRHLEKGRVVILAGGIGRPFVTTDTAAAQRALELQADVVLKATRVDGVYDSDPELNPQANLYESLSFQQVIEKDLKVMDATAIALCREQSLPILVFNFNKDGNIVRAVSGEAIGTRIA
ncbi:MAG: UMP kinase [Pirellulaceae bacterium]